MPLVAADFQVEEDEEENCGDMMASVWVFETTLCHSPRSHLRMTLIVVSTFENDHDSFVHF